VQRNADHHICSPRAPLFGGTVFGRTAGLSERDGLVFFLGENSLFDTVLKLASLFDPKNFFLPILTPKLQFLPKITLPSKTLGHSVYYLFGGPKYPSIKKCTQNGSFQGPTMVDGSACLVGLLPPRTARAASNWCGRITAFPVWPT
jgi:hypothetical protein